MADHLLSCEASGAAPRNENRSRRPLGQFREQSLQPRSESDSTVRISQLRRDAERGNGRHDRPLRSLTPRVTASNIEPTHFSGVPMKNRYSLKLALLVLAASAVWTAAAPQAEEPSATLSGEVRAAKPFQAAEVYIRNIDKHVLYMVYTESGRYETTKLLSGHYEVAVKKNGFTTDVQKVQAKAGAKLKADFSLTEGSFTPAQLALFNGPGPLRPQPLPVPYDELYPAGVGKAVVERTCVACHGSNFLPRRKWTEQSANAALDLMMNVSGGARGGGMITPAMMSPADRQAALAYITANFGADKPARSTKVEEYPLDEKVLGRAMYIEYYLPLDSPGSNDSLPVGPFGRGRRTQEPHFDSAGNVWYTDRGTPNRIGRVDPRTAEFKDFVLPVPTADPHGLTVDKQGNVFWAETNGFHLGRLDPKTGAMQRYDMNADGKSKGSLGHTPVLD